MFAQVTYILKLIMADSEDEFMPILLLLQVPFLWQCLKGSAGRASGRLGVGASGRLGVGASGRRGVGASGRRGVGASGRRGVGASGRRGVGASGRRGVGASGRRGVGASGRRAGIGSTHDARPMP